MIHLQSPAALYRVSENLRNTRYLSCSPASASASLPRRDSPHHVPVERIKTPLLKDRKVSPLVDPDSSLSRPRAEHVRERWMNRFRPGWNASPEEVVQRREAKRKVMRTRRGHIERLFNSFQRYDVSTSRKIPSDLAINLKFVSGPPNQPTEKSGPKAYPTPDRILHPDWAQPKGGSVGSSWIVCCRQAFGDARSIRGFRRKVHLEPQFHGGLFDQIDSQLIRRVAQEIVILEHRNLPISGGSNFDPEAGPLLAFDQQALQRLVALTNDASLPADSAILPLDPQKMHPGSIGAIVTTSEATFRAICGPASGSTTPSPHGDDPVVHSLPGPIPVWDLERMTRILAKDPPVNTLNTGGTADDSFVTAATDLQLYDRSIPLSAQLMKQMLDSLARQANTPSSAPPTVGYAIPLSSTYYDLIVALRRSTWWLGQGFESHHFAGLSEMLQAADKRGKEKALEWETWLTDKSRVEGWVDETGGLWVAHEAGKRRRVLTGRVEEAKCRP